MEYIGILSTRVIPKSTLIKLCFVTAVICMTYALPEDWKPKRIIADHKFSTVFTGIGENGEFRELMDLQEIKIMNDERAIVTARNNIFVLNLINVDTGKSDIKFSQVIEWDAENSSACAKKTQTQDRRKCNNFIRVSAKMSEKLYLMCGTNAHNPICREYEWSGHNFTDFYKGDKCTEPNTCLLDDGPSLAYAYSGGNLYMATRVGYRSVPTLRRAPVNGKLPSADFGVNMSSGTAVVKGDPLPHLATDNNDDSMLNDPIFVSTVETSDKIYLFFRENAMEQFGNGEATVSRVAQVCKNDRGGNKNIRKHKWTSYFKARLNCSFPGNKPFQFNELRHVTKSILINGVTTVFAVMTTPENSIWGSAVCAYSVPAIEKAMNGDFMKHAAPDATSVCLSKHGQNAPHGDHPTGCVAEGVDTRHMKSDDLRFRRDHPLMQTSIQPITDQPLFMKTQSRYLFTAIDVENHVDADGSRITLFYIGTNDGKVLKVIPRPFDTDDRNDISKTRKDGTLVEEWQVYDSAKCEKLKSKSPISANNDIRDESDTQRVITISAIKGRNVVVIGFKHCVIAIPKHSCSDNKCRRSCVQSGNPYCGWLDGSCIPVTSQNKNKIEQDLFADRKDLPNCPSEDASSTILPHIEKDNCNNSPTALVVPIAVSLSVCFLLVLVVFFIVRKCKNTRRKRTERNSSSLGRDQSFSKENVTLRDNQESNKRPIHTRETNTNGSSSKVASRPSSFAGQIPTHQRTYVGYRSEDSSTSLSGDMPPPYVYNSLDSINSFSCTSTSESERQKLHNVQLVGDVATIKKKQSNSPSTGDSNLNNNNLKRNPGIAHALARAESPVRRRSVGTMDRDDLPGTRIRMGVSSGTTANSTSRPNCLKHYTQKASDVIPVPPMKINLTYAQQGLPVDAEKYRNSSTLPQRPVSGLTFESSPNAPKMVSTYSEIDSAQARTFKRGQSLTEPYYAEPPTEPEYENTKYRKASTPGDYGRKPPTPPPADAKPGRKFSSFTASHFNTSWFPAPALNEVFHSFRTNGEPRASIPSSNSCGVSSTSSVSANGQTFTGKTRRNARSTDDGYGSELLSNENEINLVASERFPSIAETENHIYSDVPNSPICFPSSTRSPDDSNIFKELEEINWSAQATKTSKRKKQSRKKKNTDKRALVPELSSPSDCENVFAETTSPGTLDTYNMHNAQNQHGGRTLDDSFVERNINQINREKNATRPSQYAFHTMRPPGRMRQKLPRLRCGPKESDATLIAVPTPAIPQ